VSTKTPLLHADTERIIRSHLPGADEQITRLLERVSAAVAHWGLVDLVALPGGTRSAVVAGRLGDARVVVKAHLIGNAENEATVLAVMPRSPKVLDVSETALLLEYIEGEAVASDDGVRVAEAVAAVAPMHGVKSAAFIPWRTYLYERIESFAGHTITNSKDPEFVALAKGVLAVLPELTRDQELVASHGDIQGKNLLATTAGVRVLDPLGIMAPPAWEAAFAAMSVAGHGGDPTSVAAVASSQGIDLREWLGVAAVAGPGPKKDDEHERKERLLDALDALGGRRW
jgi:hypothetical protein